MHTKQNKWIKKCHIKKFKTSDFVVFDTIVHHITINMINGVISYFYSSNIQTFEEDFTADPKFSYVN